MNGVYNILVMATAHTEDTFEIDLYHKKPSEAETWICRIKVAVNGAESMCTTLRILEVNDQLYPKGGSGKIRQGHTTGVFQAVYMYSV